MLYSFGSLLFFGAKRSFLEIQAFEISSVYFLDPESPGSIEFDTPDYVPPPSVESVARSPCTPQPARDDFVIFLGGLGKG